MGLEGLSPRRRWPGPPAGALAMSKEVTMAGTQVLQLQTHTRGAVPAGAMDAAAKRVRGLLRLAPRPVPFARIKLTMLADPAVARPAIAEAHLDLNGRLIRAQATGETMREAIGHMADRLRARLERAGRARPPVRDGRAGGQPRERRRSGPSAGQPPYLPRPPRQRRVIRRKSFSLPRQDPAAAIADLESLDFDFYLFTEVSTGEDAVVYRSGGGYGLALAHPRPSRLAPVGEDVTVDGHAAPKLRLADAIVRLEALARPFLFFVDAATGRGHLIYHRYDGHYGVITPGGLRA